VQDQLKPHPTGPYASLVNVMELNRILRELNKTVNGLTGAVQTESTSVPQQIEAAALTPPTGPAVATFILTTAYNNFPLGEFTTLQRFETEGATRNVTGFLQAESGREFLVLNVDPAGGTLRLIHESVNSDANNRIICPAATTLPLATDEGARLVYDQVTGRWRAFML
jgi:hypothetical protein